MRLRAGSLDALPGIRHGFFTREGGGSTGDDPARAARDRARVCRALAVADGALAAARQVHGATALAVAAPWPANAVPEADALATVTPGIAVGVLTADCVPVLLADAEAGVVGAAHAGWRGVLAGVVDAAVSAMARLGAAPERIVAALGPRIAQQAYVVDAEFAGRFRDPADARFFTAADARGKRRFDLGGCVAARLAAAGVGTVEALPHDTYGDPARFFSYRREVRAGQASGGRQVSAIALSEESAGAP